MLSHTGLNINELNLQLKSLPPEVDYQTLMNLLKNISHPRRYLAQLQKKNILIRIKKGLYIFSKNFNNQIASSEIIANIMYGPSYISLESALSHYHLIPERTEVVTSVTVGKNKIFNTPLGSFSYDHINSKLYSAGITLGEASGERSFLIATQEKALLDIFNLRFNNKTKPTIKDIEVALVEDLRIDIPELRKTLNKKFLTDIRPMYKNRPWNRLLITYLLGDR